MNADFNETYSVDYIGSLRKDSLVLDYQPYGLWRFGSDPTWLQLSELPASRLAALDADCDGIYGLAVDFASYGLWIWQGGKQMLWMKLPIPTLSLTTADLDGNCKGDLVVNVGGGIGLWAWMNGQNWQQLHVQSPRAVVAAFLDGDSKQDLVIDLAPYGVWAYFGNQNWTKLFDGLSFGVAAAGQLDGNGQGASDYIAFGFGADGLRLWRWMWSNNMVKLHPMSPLDIVPCDLDGNGKQDLAINFGYGAGLWAWMNNAQWAKLHDLPPSAMACANLDANFKQDLAVDFAPYGLWLLKNQAWEKFGDLQAKHILALPE